MSADQQQQQQQCQRRGSDLYLGVPGGTERDDDEQSIIDVFEFDDTANDRWLCSMGNRSRRSSIETRVEDLDAWLHADITEPEASPTDSSRRSIDTRTFTRIKKRSNRLSFDAIEGSVSPETSSFSLSNVWKNNSIPEGNEQIISNNNNEKEQNTQKDKRDSIPMMLRPKTNQVLAALLSESPSSISSQSSMEAFLSLARKEGNSFLLSDISDSDVSNVLMNISQPSLLYSSIISDSKGEEHTQSMQPTPMENSLIDSQILTDSMMEASMFKEVQDTTMLAEFLKQNNDMTMLENELLFKNFDINDKTFVNDNVIDKTYINLPDQDNKSGNTTFVTNERLNMGDTFIGLPSPIHKSELNSTKLLSPQNNFLNATHTLNSNSNSLNSTKIISHDHNQSELLQNRNVLSSTLTINSENKTDLTFEVKSSESPEREKVDTTYQTSDLSQLSLLNESGSLDATFTGIPPLRAELLKEVRRTSGTKFNSTFTNPQSLNTANKLDVTYERPNSAEPLRDAQSLDATYIHVPSSQQYESPLKEHHDMTYDVTKHDSKLIPGTGVQRLSHVNKNSLEPQRAHLTDQSRFNTFRKDSKIGSRLSKVPQTQDNQTNLNTAPTMMSPQSHVPNSKGNDNSYQNKYKTFSRKTSALKNNSPSQKNTEKSKLDDVTFAKPPPRQIPAPRKLSKLPQLFQKSNPNLGSNLKLREERLSLNVGPNFCKGSQPNISSNVQPLSRFRSERLLQMKNSTEFSTSDGTSRSMESIESTESVHSAPDLDDGRSIASDSSRASYTIKPKSAEMDRRLGIAKEQTGRFNGSTPRAKAPSILENTWVVEKDMPSPIARNGDYSGSTGSRSTSPSNSSEFQAKTSSPLTISPTDSNQTINIIANDDGMEAAKENNQSAQNMKQKQIKPPTTTVTTNATKLRRPSNWTGASNKMTNGTASGIPRPASRIPAPKFARPNPK